MIWTICDDSGVEVETSVKRFFEPTLVLFWLSDRLYRYIKYYFLKIPWLKALDLVVPTTQPPHFNSNTISSCTY